MNGNENDKEGHKNNEDSIIQQDADAQDEKVLTFESALKQLEEIVGALENSELNLDDALEKFEDGVKLARFCKNKLNDANKKVEILTEENGLIKREPFDS